MPDEPLGRAVATARAATGARGPGVEGRPGGGRRARGLGSRRRGGRGVEPPHRTRATQARPAISSRRSPRGKRCGRARRDRMRHCWPRCGRWSVRDTDDGVVLLAEWPPAWNGQPFDVRDAPTRRGPVSYSVRWHGERPALLWDAPGGTRLRAPGLDPVWSTDEHTAKRCSPHRRCAGERRVLRRRRRGA